MYMKKQDERNICAVHHVPKCMSCHKAIVVITGRAHCFHDYIYIYIYIYMYIYIYIYIYICNHENNVPSRLSPQWLCGNSCTWAHDVRHIYYAHLASVRFEHSVYRGSLMTTNIYIYKYICITQKI